jgi:hypothetical protein
MLVYLDLMKILEKYSHISSSFDFLNISNKNNILIYLNNLYENEYINDEILLNFVKYLIYIFFINPSYSDIYIDIFKNLNDEENHKLFSLIKKIKLSNQMLLHDSTIEKIIISINNFIIKNYKYYTASQLLIHIYNIYDIVNCNKKICMQTKIQLYILLLKNNMNIIEIRNTLSLMNKIIS